MIEIYIPCQQEFLIYKDECKNLYENVQDKITDSNSFEFVVNNTLFYLFINDNKLIGAIYYFINTDGRLFVNGFAYRKMHNLCIKCLKMSLLWFRGKIYAEAQHRASALVLLRCGFKRKKDNLFVYENSICNPE